MSTSQSSIYSQAFNFSSFLQNGVDPRTGLYTYSIDLCDTPSQSLNLPSFKLSLHYNPLNTVDSGLGTGWAFRLPSYEPSTNTLALSTGESFKASGTNSQLSVRDQKLKNFHVTNDGSEYRIVYRSGLIEVLSNSSGLYNRFVPIALYGSTGRSIAFTWTPAESKSPRLTLIQDGDKDLVEVQYGEGQVRVIQAPGTPYESIFTLVQKNGQLVQIQSSQEKTPPWEFSYEEIDNRFVCLAQLTTPTGLLENVTYKSDGHRLPSGAPYRTIPYVISRVVQQGRQQPATTTSYAYSAENFLGYNGGQDWTPDGDNLNQVPAEYQYTSTVRVEGGSTTVNEYNKFHLLVEAGTGPGVWGTGHILGASHIKV
ncbi:hypothetical protein ABOM_000793 [Aspergillus bombycis]|uniref:RHS Repeat protein n=1 Tax=Aspergillus bombycis TaxID=109264 RepID=A0A1F8AGP3_9EURO|nr:hypothetical protein ABOM_000793 [Aspergillus bombycis]OGM50852.1 hypothetical protein ABOM_000793 [Aspergillus bombycis]